MTATTNLFLAAASAASSAATDLIEAAREGQITDETETLTALADAIRLLLDATVATGPDETQLYGAVVRYLDTGGVHDD